MSSRDISDIISRGGTSAAEVLAKRVLQSGRTKSYREANYSGMLEKIKQGDKAGRQKLAKVQRLKSKSSQARKQKLARLHQDIWLIYYAILDNERLKQERDISQHLLRWELEAPLDAGVDPAKPVSHELDAAGIAGLEDALKERETVNTATEDAIAAVEVRAWTAYEAAAQALAVAKPSNALESAARHHARLEVQKASQMLHDADAVLDEARAVAQREMVSLPVVRDHCLLSDTETWESKHSPVVVPMEESAEEQALREAMESCEDRLLSESLLEMYRDYRSSCVSRATELQQTYSNVLRRPCDGWSTADHQRFLVQTAAYQATKDEAMVKASGFSANELCLDALRRQFPEQPRAELMEHQRWIDLLRFCLRKHRELQTTQARERRALARHARQAIAKSQEILEQKMVHAAEQEKLQQVRLELTSRLLELKKAKLAEMRARDEQDTAAAIQHAATRRREEARQEALRKKAKAEVAKFRKEQRRLEAEAAAAREERQREEAAAKREAATYNAERVGFRRAEEDRKAAEQIAKMIEEERAEEERERRLQALRDTVRVEVEADPGRLVQDTASTRAAAKEGRATRSLIQASAGELKRFSVHGYDDAKITTDRRLRVEAAIRDAGLAGSDYARKLLSSVSGPTVPRRDAQSTLYRPDHGMR